MEDIKRKAEDDDLNKSEPEIGQTPRKFTPVPKLKKCMECGRTFDANTEGCVTSSVVLCDNCIVR